jgi:integrase
MDLTTTLCRIADKLDMIADLLCKTTRSQNQTLFDDFAQYYFDAFRWRRITDETKRADLSRYNTYIAPAFGHMPIIDIKPRHCQDLIDKLTNKPKTAHEILCLLNTIFKAAIKHNIIDRNPCDIVFILPYEKEHGKALSQNEERVLLATASGTAYQQMFAVALYTGLRPNEYKTAIIHNGFIVARNSKQHTGKEHKKKIPISPMLEPYIRDEKVLKFYCTNRIRDKFKEILPHHKLYDLRTTFYTRCQECGVSEVARKLFVGHSLGGLADTYTDVSDEYLIAEAQKLVY